MSGITMAPACAGGVQRVDLQNYSSYDNSGSTKSVSCDFRVDSDGYVYGHLVNTFSQHYQWLKAGAVGDYQVRATLFSGNCDAGTLNTWLSCSTDQTWTVTAFYLSDAIDNMTLDVEIRDATTQVVLDTCRITCSAESLY